MKRWVVFRENFQALRWDEVGRVDAPEDGTAVRVALQGQATVLGTYAAVPEDDLQALISQRTLFRISANIEAVEPLEV